MKNRHCAWSGTSFSLFVLEKEVSINLVTAALSNLNKLLFTFFSGCIVKEYIPFIKAPERAQSVVPEASQKADLEFSKGCQEQFQTGFVQNRQTNATVLSPPDKELRAISSLDTSRVSKEKKGLIGNGYQKLNLQNEISHSFVGIIKLSTWTTLTIWVYFDHKQFVILVRFIFERIQLPLLSWDIKKLPNPKRCFQTSDNLTGSFQILLESSLPLDDESPKVLKICDGIVEGFSRSINFIYITCPFASGQSVWKLPRSLPGCESLLPTPTAGSQLPKCEMKVGRKVIRMSQFLV